MFAASIRAFTSDAPPLAEGTGSACVISLGAAARRRPSPDREIHNAPLAALAGNALAPAFHAWFGASGRRYIFTVSPAAACGRGTSGSAVVIVVQRCGARRQPVFIGLDTDVPGLWKQPGAAEWHHHLLASTPAAREALIADLLGEERRSCEVGFQPSEVGFTQAELNKVTMRHANVVGVGAGDADALAHQ